MGGKALRGLHRHIQDNYFPNAECSAVVGEIPRADRLLEIGVHRLEPAAVDRAIALSRDKYCSVWHSMRHDIDLKVTYQVVSG